MGKYILLGGAGFIGQNLARLLLTTNNQIIIYDRNISEKILDTNILESVKSKKELFLRIRIRKIRKQCRLCSTFNKQCVTSNIYV